MKSKFKSFVSNIKFQGISASLSGISINMEYAPGKKIGAEHLRELYVMHNTLSYFCYSYHTTKSKLYMELEDPEEVDTELIRKFLPNVFGLYHEIANVLMGSEFFWLMPKETRNQLIQAFDFVVQERVNYEVYEELQHEEISLFFTDMLQLFELISEQIDEISN